jgi:hypothetical protein
MSKGHTIEKTEAHNFKRRPPAKDGPKMGQKAPGPAGPFLWRFEPPFGLGLLRGINSDAAKIRRHPSRGTRRNLGETDEGRRRSSRVLEVV